MKTLKGILFAATILCLAGAGWAQGQGEKKGDIRPEVKGSSETHLGNIRRIKLDGDEIDLNRLE